MSLVSRSMSRVAPRSLSETGGADRYRLALSAALAGGGAGLGLLSLHLEAALVRYDTLGYLLESSHTGQLALIRTLLQMVAAAAAVLAVLALKSGRIALALCGWGGILVGSLAWPFARAFLAPERGLEESLQYRLRGLSAVGWIGGTFLVFLALLPRLLASPPGSWERRATEWLKRRRDGLEASPPLRRLAAGTLAFALAVGVGWGVLAHFPNSSDENSYLTQARIFASGRLWVDAPPHPEFFRARSFVMDEREGRFFAKAFPGWAAVLAIGVKAGMPWIVNPILSALTLVLLGRVAGEMLGARGEMLAVGTVLITPFFLLNAASYFNHPVTLLLITVFLLGVLRIAGGGGWSWAVTAGTAAAVALTIRPVSAVALASPFLVWLGVTWLRERKWGMLSATFLPVIGVLLVLGLYNQQMFGSVWTTGYQAYDRADIRAALGTDNFRTTAWWLLKLLLWTVPGSLAGLWFLGRGKSVREWFRREPIPALMACGLTLLGFAYLLLQNKGGNEYGPRYYYDGLAYLSLLTTAGWMRAPRLLSRFLPEATARRGTALALGSGILLTLLASGPFLLWHYRDKVEHNRDLYTAISRSGIRSALVFLETGSGRMPPGDLVRNPLDFRSGVVYARDLGPEADRALSALYPDRPALVYAYDPYQRRSTLRALGEDR